VITRCFLHREVKVVADYIERSGLWAVLVWEVGSDEPGDRVLLDARLSEDVFTDAALIIADVYTPPDEAVIEDEA
jgi:hypothetical protein